MPITARHDPEAQYVRLRPGPPEATVEMGGFVVDVDADNTAVGFEVLSLPVRWVDLVQVASKFGFAEQLGAVRQAVLAAMPPTAATRTRRSGQSFSLIWELAPAQASVGSLRASAEVRSHEYALSA